MKLLIQPRFSLPNPKLCNIQNWPVIACDQYTSNKDYWTELKIKSEKIFSAANICIPEALYINDNDENFSNLIENSRKNQIEYLKSGIFEVFTNCGVYIERVIKSGTRKGILMLLDLEIWTKTGANHLISSEKTDTKRLKQRYKIRKESILELSHTMVFYEDKKDSLNNGISKSKQLYQVYLDKPYGEIRGYQVLDSTYIDNYIADYLKERKLIVADGNHSLSASKLFWQENLANNLENSNEYSEFRYQLIELVNIYDKSVVLHPIHRLISNVSLDEIDYISSAIGVKKIKNNLIDLSNRGSSNNEVAETYSLIENFFSSNFKKHWKIDFIHDTKKLEELITNEKVGIKMPKFNKVGFFQLVLNNGILPKKSFSVGHSFEKRFYYEIRKLS